MKSCVRSGFALLLSLLLCLSTACTGSKAPPPTAMEVLSAMQKAMTDTAQTIPDGLTYTRNAPPSSPAYLTEVFFSALYGEAAVGLFELPPPDTVPPRDGSASGGGVAAVGDAALFLSVSPYPCELAVLRCSNLATATTVAGLCRSRLDTVARGYAETEWAEIAAGGRVAVEGCYVLLVIAEDPAAVLSGARRILP